MNMIYTTIIINDYILKRLVIIQLYCKLNNFLIYLNILCYKIFEFYLIIILFILDILKGKLRPIILV